MARFFRKLQAPIRKVWDAWSKLQTDEDARWKNSVGGRSTSHKGFADPSERDMPTEASSLLEGHTERPIGATRAPGKSGIGSENESAAGLVPTLFELVAQRQSEYKPTTAKNLSKGDAGR